MKILVACEFSGIVREALRLRGHDAYSLDVLPSEIPSQYHIQAELISSTVNYLLASWDGLIYHPPCRFLASSGARWHMDMWKERWEAIKFFMAGVEAPIPRIAIENPIGIMSTVYRKPDQIIQPWQFGHGETKATCLWLKGLPKLQPTDVVDGREPRVHHEPPSDERWKNRSRTLQGIADAMASQWFLDA